MNIFYNKSRTLVPKTSSIRTAHTHYRIVAMHLLENEKRKKGRICAPALTDLKIAFALRFGRRCRCVSVFFRSLAGRRYICWCHFFPIANFFPLAMVFSARILLLLSLRGMSVAMCELRVTAYLLTSHEFNNIITSLIPPYWILCNVPHISGIALRRCLLTIFNFALNIYDANRIKITFEPVVGIRNGERYTRK